jgi:hypothetical protein
VEVVAIGARPDAPVGVEAEDRRVAGKRLRVVEDRLGWRELAVGIDVDVALAEGEAVEKGQAALDLGGADPGEGVPVTRVGETRPPRRSLDIADILYHRVVAP